MLLCPGRCELVSGASEPTAAELEGYKGPVLEPGSSEGKGLPCFWLHVLRSQVSRNGMQLGTEVEGGEERRTPFLPPLGPLTLPLPRRPSIDRTFSPLSSPAKTPRRWHTWTTCALCEA